MPEPYWVPWTPWASGDLVEWWIPKIRHASRTLPSSSTRLNGRRRTHIPHELSPLGMSGTTPSIRPTADSSRPRWVDRRRDVWLGGT